jgi:hypothetical protein
VPVPIDYTYISWCNRAHVLPTSVIRDELLRVEVAVNDDVVVRGRMARVPQTLSKALGSREWKRKYVYMEKRKK